MARKVLNLASKCLIARAFSVEGSRESTSAEITSAEIRAYKEAADEKFLRSKNCLQRSRAICCGNGPADTICARSVDELRKRYPEPEIYSKACSPLGCNPPPVGLMLGTGVGSSPATANFAAFGGGGGGRR